MTNRAVGYFLSAAFVAVVSAGALAADEIKSGRWQFTTQMQTPSTPQSAAGAQTPPGAGRDMTQTACITAANPIPAAGQCTVDKVQRNGNVVTWAMTCNTPQGSVPSAGTARFAGDTMEATMTARIPGPNGRSVDAPGRITGRYLGPCEGK